jgi:hypothetical protein
MTNYYLVEIDTDNEFFKKFRRFFRQHNTSNDPDNYSYAGFTKGNEEEGDEPGDGYNVTDDETIYPEAEIISLNEWAQRFPSEGNLTALPEFYLVETDNTSKHWKEFRHFVVDQTEDNIGMEDYSFAGNTENGWLATDEPYDYPECDIITLDEWKSFQGIVYSTF